MKDEIKIDIVSIKLVKEKEEGSLYYKIGSPKDAVSITRKLIGCKDREHLISMCLNVRNEITNVSTISIGSVNSSIVHPREVFKTAILSNASSIIIAHNHPGGSIQPSNEDESITRRLKRAGKILGIDVLDHIIIGFDNEGYYSFREKGML